MTTAPPDLARARQNNKLLSRYPWLWVILGTELMPEWTIKTQRISARELRKLFHESSSIFRVYYTLKMATYRESEHGAHQIVRELAVPLRGECWLTSLRDFYEFMRGTRYIAIKRYDKGIKIIVLRPPEGHRDFSQLLLSLRQ